jgi:hypothetical protein
VGGVACRLSTLAIDAFTADADRFADWAELGVRNQCVRGPDDRCP